MYRSLDANRIIDTAEQLGKRITERFPASSLSKVAGELLSEVRQAADTAKWLSAPHRNIRIVSGVVVVLLFALVISTLLLLNRRVELFSSVSDFLQGLDAAVNELVLIGAASYFLLNWESRRKRKRALRALHVLRSMAHIVDMHQLTKDPERLMGPGQNTPSSPVRKLTAFELTRYLDYCSEMLSVISKVAALYVQEFDDPVTLAAVNEVENLTGSLSQKMWQKIIILDRALPESS
ncbi:MAG: hypothetical protein H7Y02_04115 [Candidatus Obscuribacterales bacterium]|nr:hypothetical protein [Steroidobacteraceae bacterium]